MRCRRMGKQKTKMRRRLELAKPLKMKPEWRGKSVKKKRKGMHVKLPTEKPRKRRLENVKKLSGDLVSTRSPLHGRVSSYLRKTSEADAKRRSFSGVAGITARSMELGLDDLECTSEALRAWSPLRTQAQEVAELWRTGRLQDWRPEMAQHVQEPPEGLEALSYSLIDTHRVNAHELYDHFWGDRETAEHNLWPFEHYCILGHATALYVLAWAASSRREFIEAEYFLTTAVAMLRMDDHDFFEHTSWPFTSFDLLSNLYFVRLQWPFQATHVKPHPEGSGHLRTRLPLVWPSYAPRCWPHCPTERPEWSKRPLKVWWTSKNPGPFVDFATLVERWMGDRRPERWYARYKDWLCSKDERFKEVMQEQRILSEMSQADCGED
eukprot:g1668.t1